MDFIRFLLSVLLEGLSVLPVWIRPWLLALLLVTAGWYLVLRSGAKRITVLAMRIVLGVGVVVLTVPLVAEYVDTRRRRLSERSPSRFAAGVSEVVESIGFSVVAIDGRLATCRYRARTWPRKTMLLLAAAGTVSWIVFSSTPALAASTTFGGKAYGLWDNLEHWAHSKTSTTAVPAGEPVPVLVLRKTNVILSTSAAHRGEIAEVRAAGSGSLVAQAVLNQNGNAAIRLTRANKPLFARGSLFYVEATGLRALVRVI